MKLHKTNRLCVVPVVLGIWLQPSWCLLDAPSVKDFRWRSLQSVATLGDYLYIDGGQITQYVNGSLDVLSWRPSPYPRYQFLLVEKAWTPSNVSINMILKGPSPTVKNPALWPDANSGVMYSWAGEGFFPNLTAAQNIHLYKFTPDNKGGGSWASGPAPGQDIRPGTAGTSITCAGRGFLLGGYASYASDTRFISNTPQPGMLIYDFESSTWENKTAPAPYSPHLQGQAACLPFGNKGLVSFLGGAQMTRTSVSTQEYVGFGNMTFYDPSTDEWFWQTTTGDIPGDRKRYCSVGAAGPNGTYEIYIYGGLDPQEGVLSDVSVLSIPAFQWFRASTDNNPRVDQRCAIAGNRQMISVGGHMQGDNPGPGDRVDPAQDPWAQGVGVFDLSTLTWTQEYDPTAAAYDTPADIKSWYNSHDLNAVPWVNDQVKSTFFNSSSNNSSTTHEDKAHSSSTPVGAIAGGVVGGIAALAAFVGAYMWYRRRAKRSVISELGTGPSGNDPAPKADSELEGSYDVATPVATPPQEMPVPMEEPNAKYQLAAPRHPVELATSNGYHEVPQS